MGIRKGEKERTSKWRWIIDENLFFIFLSDSADVLLFPSPIFIVLFKVTRCFADMMKCNQFRRIDLEKEFFIDCSCPRCNDGSELGTNFGGIIIQVLR